MESGFMDYNEFKNLLDKSEPTHLYEELIKKEERVLQTVNRVVDYSNRKELQAKEFMNVPIGQAPWKFLATMLDILNDLIKARDVGQAARAMFKEDRIIHVGIMVVITSLFLFFVESSNVK